MLLEKITPEERESKTLNKVVAEILGEGTAPVPSRVTEPIDVNSQAELTAEQKFFKANRNYSTKRGETLGEVAGWTRTDKKGKKRTPYNERKDENLRLAEAYRQSDKVHHQKLAERLISCSRWMLFTKGTRKEDGEPAVKFKHALHCHVRFCPICQHDRAKKKLQAFYDALPNIEIDHPGYSWCFLTIALKNVPANKVRKEFQRLNESFGRATERKKWPAEGWIVTRELTRGEDGSAHPHLHVMMLMPPTYYVGEDYLDHAEWLKFVRSTFKVNYDPAVHIKKVKAGKEHEEELREAVLEVFKYTVKSQDLLMDLKWLFEITDQMHQLKAQTVGGVLRKYLKVLEHDSVDDIEIDKWFIPDKGDNEICVSWNFKKREYLIIKPPKPFVRPENGFEDARNHPMVS